MMPGMPMGGMPPQGQPMPPQPGQPPQDPNMMDPQKMAILQALMQHQGSQPQANPNQSGLGALANGMMQGVGMGGQMGKPMPQFGPGVIGGGL